MSIEDLAFKAELSKNYMGMVERGERIPSLESLLKIINALEVSADEILCDVITHGFKVKTTILADKLDNVSPEKQALIYDLIDLVLKHSE
ncbi:MAG: helix-turn-helix transcriptional regulator [Bacteroidales bacterium]|nr:helix-turn-helix transcriptional regulator [Bacteroidales bacterium]